MPILQNFAVTRGDTVDLVISLSPPTAIGGWDLLFAMGNRFGGAGNLFRCYLTAGQTNGTSGITIQNSGQGVFSVAFPTTATSGLNYGDYAYWAQKTAPNIVTVTEGYVILAP